MRFNVQPRISDVLVPEIEVSEERLEWARTPIDLVTEVEGRNDVDDIEKFEMGCAVSKILNDDSNCFAWAAFEYDPAKAAENKEFLRIRLGWEVGVSRFPDEVRILITNCTNDVMTKDWKVEKEYMRAMNNWHVMRESLRDMMRENGELGRNLYTAYQYYLDKTS